MTPDRGLYTAIVGGFPALGGNQFQICGPAGAFIVFGGVDRRTPRQFTEKVLSSHDIEAHMRQGWR